MEEGVQISDALASNETFTHAIATVQCTFLFLTLPTPAKVKEKQHSITFRYGDVAGAAAQADGLAVLGVLFRMADEDNPALGPLMEAARRIKD